MSGHNKWSQIKRKKEATDKEKSKNFARVGKEIRLSVKKAGPDPSSNAALRNALQRAREVNMPKASIDRAIERGSGKGGVGIIDVMYEAYGPGGVALLIKAQTDNKNRTVAELKHLIELSGGRMADAGSVSWLFSEKGFIHVQNEKEDARVEEIFIDENVDDYSFSEGKYIALCSPESISSPLKILEKEGFNVEGGVSMIAQNQIMLDEKDKKNLENMIEALEDHEDVEDVYTNIKA